MQARECQFLLPTGRNCRCAATRNQPFCRHHGPKTAVPGPPPIPRNERYSDLSRWRQLGSELHCLPTGEIPCHIYGILQCLVDRGLDSTGSISDLTAGRFLRALLNRLGDVPFPDPDLIPGSSPAFAPPPSPGLARPVATPAGAPELQELSAMLTALGVPPSHATLPPSRARVNQ